MKRFILILTIVLLAVPAGIFADVIGAPECTQGEAWQSVVDNAYRIAEDYAEANNPLSTFMTSIEDYKFIKQTDGSFKGKYLLIITTIHENDCSTAILLPLFDVNKSSYDLNVEKPLWRLVRAELNGKGY